MTLVERRKAAGFKQSDIAKKLNVTECAVSNWETGRNGIAKKYAKKLAKLYGCKPNELFGDEGGKDG